MNLSRFFRMFEPLPTIIILVVALPFLIIGLVEARKAQVMINNSATALGRVIDNAYLSRKDASDSTRLYWSYHAVVRFVADNGGEFTFTDRVGSYLADHAIGDAVEVLYDPKNPQDATIRRWASIRMGPSDIHWDRAAAHPGIDCLDGMARCMGGAENPGGAGRAPALRGGRSPRVQR
jgi:hypothetical protein